VQVAVGAAGRVDPSMPDQFPGSATVLHRDVAPGVHWLECARTNMYLVQTGDRVLIVDAGLPRMWSALQSALEQIGANPEQVDGVVLTHGHFDHVGMARRIRGQWDVPVWVHPADRRLAAHPYRYRTEDNRLIYTLTHPEFVPNLLRLLAAGAAWVDGIEDTHPVDGTGAAELLARHGAMMLETPGHTDGHIALHLPQRDVLLVGDTLVTFDPYKNRPGPQIIAGAATADSDTNMASLQVLAGTDARTVLPGHGDPWHGGIVDAVEQARTEVRTRPTRR
jgi:glyoxylase-like metal-dependent hydrolase (beta-lactamase superfamily II)